MRNKELQSKTDGVINEVVNWREARKHCHLEVDTLDRIEEVINGLEKEVEYLEKLITTCHKSVAENQKKTQYFSDKKFNCDEVVNLILEISSKYWISRPIGSRPPLVVTPNEYRKVVIYEVVNTLI